MIGRSVSVSFSLTLPNISISLHKSWFMIHKREKWHGNSCKTTIYKWFEFCQNSETTNQNDSRDTKMVRRFAILTNSKCSNFVKLSKRMHIRPHDKSSFEWILSNFIDGRVWLFFQLKNMARGEKRENKRRSSEDRPPGPIRFKVLSVPNWKTDFILL